MNHRGSMLSNLHNQVRIAEYQSCDSFHMPDMLTVTGTTHPVCF